MNAHVVVIGYGELGMSAAMCRCRLRDNDNVLGARRVRQGAAERGKCIAPSQCGFEIGSVAGTQFMVAGEFQDDAVILLIVAHESKEAWT